MVVVDVHVVSRLLSTRSPVIADKPARCFYKRCAVYGLFNNSEARGWHALDTGVVYSA